MLCLTLPPPTDSRLEVQSIGRLPAVASLRDLTPAGTIVFNNLYQGQLPRTLPRGT